MKCPGLEILAGLPAFQQVRASNIVGSNLGQKFVHLPYNVELGIGGHPCRRSLCKSHTAGCVFPRGDFIGCLLSGTYAMLFNTPSLPYSISIILEITLSSIGQSVESA